MNVSLHADYAFRVLMYLALADQKLVQVNEISEAYGISENHLLKIVHRLSGLGYVSATRGRNGGIRLAQKPHKINLGRLFRQVEPSLQLLECFEKETSTCPLSSSCSLKSVFFEARSAFLEVLDGSTLENVLVGRTKLKRAMRIG